MASSSASSGTGGGVCNLGHVVISEVRSRGVGGGADEFVELWNPTAASIALDSSWMIEGRSATAGAYNARWKGAAGLSIPAHGHFLIASSGYVQAPTADDKLLTGITDATSLRLVQAAVTVDAICYAFSPATLMAFDATYSCEGVPVSNLPHNDGSGAASNVDASLERLPGGAAGSCADTDDSTADFAPRSPADPQSTMSAPTP
ncbi:MAG: lamin tail domain-containing protein [Byssovorax sp.]